MIMSFDQGEQVISTNWSLCKYTFCPNLSLIAVQAGGRQFGSRVETTVMSGRELDSRSFYLRRDSRDFSIYTFLT